MDNGLAEEEVACHTRLPITEMMIIVVMKAGRKEKE